MSNPTEVTIPDIGDIHSVDVIEVLVAPGDSVQRDAPLVTLESDKATMDVPAPCAGTVIEIRIAVGDQVSEGNVILLLEEFDKTDGQSANTVVTTQGEEGIALTVSNRPVEAEESPSETGTVTPPLIGHSPPSSLPPPVQRSGDALPHASPAVRSFARELGVDLRAIRGSGSKGRILKSDVQQFIKNELTRPSQPIASDGREALPLPEVDFSKWGPIEIQPLSRIQKRSGRHLQQTWQNVPHVTHHEEVDVTDLENFRKALKDEAAKKGLRVTLLPFLMKAVTATLAEFPRFNASLAPSQDELILKRYFHLGLAVDTTNGLVVPVIQNVDQKGIYQLAAELADVSARSRDGKLKPEDLQGGCFSISSLGGIGGRGFTPIVNAPEVAILGVSRTQTLPQWNGKEFEPRLMLPLDLSYDHRVIDGVAAARFLVLLKKQLEDARLLLL
jgi:pyruvate dehydrogenase E2 component (dihydrolipoamide acetyltransferase)